MFREWPVQLCRGELEAQVLYLREAAVAVAILAVVAAAVRAAVTKEEVVVAEAGI